MLKFRLRGLKCEIPGSGDLGLRVCGVGLGIWCVVLRGLGSGFRIWSVVCGLGFRVWGVGFRAQGSVRRVPSLGSRVEV